MRLSAVPATLVLLAVVVTALLADRLAFLGALVAVLVGIVLRFGPRGRRRLYLAGAAWSALGVFLVWPLFTVVGYTVLWSGPTVPVLGHLDVTVEELELGGVYALRLAAVALAFAVYALLVDHDRLLASLRFARRSAFAAVLATRLVPTLERDAAGLAEALRGRGVPVEGLRARAGLVSPLVAGSLERALNLAESMEARGFGRPGRTRMPSAGWTRIDRVALVVAALGPVAGALWL